MVKSKAIPIAAGQRFGKWTVIEESPERKHGGRAYVCRCECGGIYIVGSNELRRGTSTQCLPCKYKVTPTKFSKDITERPCNVCGKVKPKSEFHKNRSTTYGITSVCKECVRKQRKEWHSKPENKKKTRNRNLQHAFGITVDDYDALYTKQNGVCAICGKKEQKKNKYGVRRLVVDHNHITGKIRGLLCSCCNQGLGMFYTDSRHTDLLLNAVEYMRANDE